MSWLRAFLDCFRCENEAEDSDVYGHQISPELRHPMNVALLPKPKSGCRGVFIIHDDGRVKVTQENEEDQQVLCTPCKPESSPAGGSVHTPESMIIPDMTDEDFLEENQKLLWAAYGATLKHRAAAVSSSDSSNDNRIVHKNEAFMNANSPLAGEHDEIPDVKMSMDAAAEPVTSSDTCSTPPKPPLPSIAPTPGIITAQLSEDRPKLTASRTKTKCGQVNSSATSSGTMNVPKIQVPSLLDTPNEFWVLFHALAHQLGTYFKASPNHLRPFHWETDGCICRYLFPPLTPEQKSDLFTRYTLQRFPPEPTPLVIRQLPVPQTAILE